MDLNALMFGVLASLLAGILIEVSKYVISNRKIIPAQISTLYQRFTPLIKSAALYLGIVIIIKFPLFRYYTYKWITRIADQTKDLYEYCLANLKLLFKKRITKVTNSFFMSNWSRQILILPLIFILSSGIIFVKQVTKLSREIKALQTQSENWEREYQLKIDSQNVLNAQKEREIATKEEQISQLESMLAKEREPISSLKIVMVPSIGR